jgi:hypothetical protein
VQAVLDFIEPAHGSLYTLGGVTDDCN